jgi:hypothetical protein
MHFLVSLQCCLQHMKEPLCTPSSISRSQGQSGVVTGFVLFPDDAYLHVVTLSSRSVHGKNCKPRMQLVFAAVTTDVPDLSRHKAFHKSAEFVLPLHNWPLPQLFLSAFCHMLG